MSFEYSQYLILVIFLWIGFSYFYLKSTKGFFSWVKDHWFFKQSIQHKISTGLYCLGLLFLSLALLDFRGPEKIITSNTPDQRTIILIDSSASMLTEDIRPNRFNKALLLAKHYIKRAVGQKISIVVFSDGTKRIVPFTEDSNLVDARLERLKTLNLARGGTSLTLAIKESLQYFVSGDPDEAGGNILIFTDAEETDGGVEIKIPDNVSVGVVGIGTRKGKPVPKRDSKGIHRGNIKYKGKLVISKLDEDFLKNLGEQIKNYKYWVATSYSLPTAEILNFFSGIHKAKNQENSFRVKPVLANYLMIPGIICLMLSFLFGRRKTFVLTSLFLLFSVNGFPQDEEPEKSQLTLKLEEKFIKGELDDQGKKALATSLLKDNFPQEAVELYDEVLEDKITEENKNHKLNKATALLKMQKLKEGVDEYNKIIKHLEANKSKENDDMLKIAKSNIAKIFKQSQGQGKGKKKNSDDENKQNNSDQQQGDGEGQEKDKSDKQDGDKGDQKKNKDDQGDGDKKKKDKKNKSESKEEREKRKKKLPALLKQLMNDDNQLQKKMIDAKTTKRKGYDRKDW